MSKVPAGVFFVALLALLFGCGDRSTPEPLFELLSPEETGVTFRNDLPDEPELNILNYLYYYNGGGVAVADVDGNGYYDLYFTANLGPNRLFLNQGDYRFVDVTETAGVAGLEGWTSGATFADVNGDGLPDLYVSGVEYLSSRGGNILYINNGDGTFTDRTEAFGLAHVGYSTQALFVDIDGDGDLDMYLLNHSTHDERGESFGMQSRGPHPAAGDRLFRNDGGHFTDITEEAGIYAGAEGYGLGVVASDLNLDGCIDIYVGNDFEGDDLLYLNNCDGTFTEVLSEMTGHTSRFAMGVDAADFNNDGLPDVFVADMLPEDEEIMKTSANAEKVQTFELRMRAGYHPQYARNTLQLNRGGGRFSEIGYLAGVHATDWSWATLFADLDNDGWKDLFVTNGIYRRPNDLDYIDFVGQASVQTSLAQGVTRENLVVRDRMPHVPISNYLFRNNGDLTFTNVADEWGLGRPGFGNGAVYVDLDNSGSLDLVVNNVNAPASIYRNRARELSQNHYLKVQLEGPPGNTQGIGARVIIEQDGTQQMVEQVPTRGFQSSVDPRPHFGLGAADRVQRLTVIWPDRRQQTLTGIPADTTITLNWREAEEMYQPPAPPEPLFRDGSDRIQAASPHVENPFFDFNREPLIPHQLSREGPALAVADVNGDGLDDLFLGGAKWQPGQILLQQADGSFALAAGATEVAFRADSMHEDVAAVFFDANGDGHPDLYVASGGNEFWGEAEALRDRLYLNDGVGGFTRADGALPEIYGNSGAVAAGDFDGDGQVDLFVGGRVVAREYGRIPRSYLLRNEGGRFVDVTETVAPGLAEVGMVTSAAWIFEEGQPAELVVTGEWMPVKLYRMEEGQLQDRTAEMGLAGSEGWWNHVAAVDLNGDGRRDLVLGNLGLNSYVNASEAEPARMYVADFAGNGTLQQILTVYRDGGRYPFLGRDELVEGIPSLRGRYPTYADFGATTAEEIVGRQALNEAAVFEAHTFASAVALRGPDGRFALQPLPAEAQFAPVYASVADDFDGDGSVDLLIGGNFHGVTPLRGRYDASYGLLLRGDGAGEFEAVPLERSGVAVEGEIRGMVPVRGPGGKRSVVFGRNDAAAVLLEY